MKLDFERYKVVYQDESVRLLHFSNGSGTPVLVLPPYAGRHGNISQPMIDRLAAEGKSVYAYEQLPATSVNCDLSVLGLTEKLKEYVWMIQMTNFDGDIPKVDLIGHCQGGWLATLYTLKYPNTVNRLAIFAAPINTHTGEKNSIEEYCKTINLDAHRKAIELNGGVQPGLLQWLSFTISNPIPVLFSRHVDQFFNILKGDTKAENKWYRDNNWLDSPQNIPGTLTLEALEHHFKNNELYEGTWRGFPTLESITCPVFAYAGDRDEVTHPKQVLDILEKVSGTKLGRVFKDSGHTATFTRRENIDQFIKDFYLPL